MSEHVAAVWPQALRVADCVLKSHLLQGTGGKPCMLLLADCSRAVPVARECTALCHATESGDCFSGADQPPDSLHEQLLDYVMLRLRLSDGLDLAQLAARFGAQPAAAAAESLAPHVSAGLAEVAYRYRSDAPEPGPGALAAGGQGGVDSLSGCVVRLTDPEGFLVSNDVISDVFAALVPDSAGKPAADQAMVHG